ncbi:hypothetical protein LSAT2_011028 [Lamellibrachia satsuma]|nr:hypothetical protein LSAT2_011028 [Lamellibrachia satsuma]
MVTLVSASILLTLLLYCHQISDTTAIVITRCTQPTAPTVTLNCTSPQKVYIMNVTFGRTACTDQRCCLNDSVCLVEAYAKHFQLVKDRCDGEYMCTVTMVTGWCKGPRGGNTDYESVHYVCSSIDPAITTATTTAAVTAVADLTTTMWSPGVNSGTRHSTAMMSRVPATSVSTSPDTTRTEVEVRMGDSSGSQGNVEHLLLILSACLNGLLIVALLVSILIHTNRLPCAKHPAIIEQELYASNISQTMVETPSTYDTLTPSQPQQQPEPTDEPVDNEYYNITSDPVKYENIQMNPTAGDSTSLNNGDTMDGTPANRQQQTSTDYSESYGNMPV